MSMENRANSSLFKRAEQLRRWEESETNRASGQPRVEPKKIKFSDGCVFLSACSANDYAEIDRLLVSGADIDTPNIDGLTALHQACIDDNLDMVEYLVRKGADINKGDNEGWTPLHATASCGFMSIARFLIDHGADVSAVNNDGELPVDIAESDDMEELLQREIETQGIDCETARNMEEDRMMEDVNHWINTRQFSDRPHSKTGATALHVASAKGYIKVMSLLLRAGSDINAQDNDGWTPLHAAAHWAQKESCELLCEQLADMNIKNYAGQTVFDVADSELLRLLEELKKKQAEDLKKKQASILKADMLNNLVPRSSVNRLSNHDRTQLIARDVNTEKKLLGQDRIETSSSASETDVESAEGSDVERKNQSGEESATSSPSSVSSSGSDKSKVPSFTPSKLSEEDDGGVPSWRRPGSVRTRPTSIGIILPNNASSPVLGAVSAPTTPSAEKDELSRSLSDSSGAVSTQSTSSLVTGENDPSEVTLRRAISFDPDTSGEGASKGGASCSASSNGKSSGPAPATRSEIGSKGNSASSQTEKPPSANVRSGPLSAHSTTLPPSALLAPPTTPISPSAHSAPPTTPPTPPSATPLINGASVQTNGIVQNGKQSAGSMIKNFFKSFVPPVRDDESETQRKAHAKQVRATRRSTQGVTLEEIKSAEQIMKQKKPTEPSQVPSSSVSTVPFAAVTTASTTVPSATPLVSSTAQSAEDLERRPSWRLRVDDAKNKFTLEEAKGAAAATVATVTPLRPPRGLSTPLIVPTVEIEAQLPDVPIETIAKRIKTVEDVNKDLDSKNGTGAQLTIQRRRRPKRRSTGVVQVGLEEIDPDRQNQEGDGDENDDDDESLSDRASSRPSRPASTSSSLAGDSVPPSGRTTPSPSEVLPQSEELDYKKLYEEQKTENGRLRDQMQETKNELTDAKAKLERSVQVSNARTALSEVEKRERRALERKLSEMEEELKQLQKLKAENEKLKAENRALTRVVTKLTATGGQATS